MKTRDKIKYAFASLLALMTFSAIGVLVFARYERQRSRPDQEVMIHQTLQRYGQNGALPDKVELPESESVPMASQQ